MWCLLFDVCVCYGECWDWVVVVCVCWDVYCGGEENDCGIVRGIV